MLGLKGLLDALLSRIRELRNTSTFQRVSILKNKVTQMIPHLNKYFKNVDLIRSQLLRNLKKSCVTILLIFASVPVLMLKVKRKLSSALVTSNSVDG